MAALGISQSNGLFDLSPARPGRPYGMFFTCALYLTIGPFFAIPRCATTSYTVGLEQILPEGHAKLFLLLFSAVFFAVTLFFSLRPGKILTWIGKVLNPCFLLFLGILLVVALVSPGASISSVEPMGNYATQPFLTGFLEGYNTMDALAGLAFGIIVVQVIQGLGVKEPKDVAGSTVRSGIFSCLLDGRDLPGRSPSWDVGAAGLFAAAANGGIAAGPDRPALPARRGSAGPGRHRHAGLPENRGGLDHQLQRDLRRSVPQGARLTGSGRIVFCLHVLRALPTWV